MAFLDDGSISSLEDVLGRQADTASMNISNQFAKKRKKLVAQQAHSGRLGSGVANYSLGDLDAQEVGALGDVQGGLADSLAQVPIDDYALDQEYQRKRQLAEKIASLNRPSTLEQVLGGIGTAASVAGAAKGFF